MRRGGRHRPLHRPFTHWSHLEAPLSLPVTLMEPQPFKRFVFWTEEPGGLQFVSHKSGTRLSDLARVLAHWVAQALVAEREEVLVYQLQRAGLSLRWPLLLWRTGSRHVDFSVAAARGLHG